MTVKSLTTLVKKVDFPVYGLDFTVDDHVVAVGGGGSGRSGVKNKLVPTNRRHSERRDVLKLLPDFLCHRRCTRRVHRPSLSNFTRRARLPHVSRLQPCCKFLLFYVLFSKAYTNDVLERNLYLQRASTSLKKR